MKYFAGYLAIDQNGNTVHAGKRTVEDNTVRNEIEKILNNFGIDNNSTKEQR